MGFLAEQEEAQERDAPRWHLPARDVSASLGGAHLLHRFIGRWDGGEVGEWVVLCEQDSGEAVLDMAHVKSAAVAWREDGALLVRVDGPATARLMIVEPDMQSFRDVGVGGPRPLAELQGAVAGAAWEVGADGGPAHPSDAYVQRDFSPDGRVMVEYAIVPQRMSHETRVPRLVDTATGQTLLTMPDTQFDGSISWREGRQAVLHVRHYDDGAHAGIVIDYAARTFWNTTELRESQRPLKGAAKEIARAVRRSAREQARPLEPAVDWKGIFVVLVICILGTAGSFAAGWYLTEKPKQVLTPLPTFPRSR